MLNTRHSNVIITWQRPRASNIRNINIQHTPSINIQYTKPWTLFVPDSLLIDSCLSPVVFVFLLPRLSPLRLFPYCLTVRSLHQLNCLTSRSRYPVPGPIFQRRRHVLSPRCTEASCEPVCPFPAAQIQSCYPHPRCNRSFSLPRYNRENLALLSIVCANRVGSPISSLTLEQLLDPRNGGKSFFVETNEQWQFHGNAEDKFPISRSIEPRRRCSPARMFKIIKLRTTSCRAGTMERK